MGPELISPSPEMSKPPCPEIPNSDDDAFFSLIGSEKRLSLQVEVGNATVTCKRARDTWARAFAHILGAIHIIGLNND